MNALIVFAAVLVLGGLFGMMHNDRWKYSVYVFKNHLYSTIPTVIGVIMMIYVVAVNINTGPIAEISFPEGYEAIQKGDTLLMHEEGTTMYLEFYGAGSPKTCKLFIVK